MGIATQSEVSDWLQHTVADVLSARLSLLRKLQERGADALLGPEQRDQAAQNTRVLESIEPPTSETLEPGNTPHSIETKSHATEVRSAWPWLLAGLVALATLALFVSSSLRGDRHEPAIAPLVAPAQELPSPSPAAPAPAPRAEVLPLGLSPSAAGAAARAGSDAQAPVRRAPPKRTATKKTATEAQPVQPASIADPQCSPVIYRDGIRRINPDCPQPVRPKQ